MDNLELLLASFQVTGIPVKAFLFQEVWTYDTAYGQKPDHDHDGVSQSFGILPLFTIHGNSFQKLKTNVQIKDSGHANRTKESDEDRLSLFLNLVDEFVHGENNRQTSRWEM
tara:strand:+ start:507 stop:842 length:336 start_codon:yes stop_codon:yes gene_type:complete